VGRADAIHDSAQQSVLGVGAIAGEEDRVVAVLHDVGTPSRRSHISTATSASPERVSDDRRLRLVRAGYYGALRCTRRRCRH
jgi:hypothetical protein